MTILNEFKKRKNLQLVGKSLGFLLSEKFLRIVLGFFITAWISRQLGPENYGSYVYVTQYIMIFMPLVMFGMNELIARDLVDKEIPEGEVLGTALAIKLINSAIGIILVALSTLFVSFTPQEENLVFWLTILLLIQAFALVDHWYEAHLEYKSLVFARNLGYLVGVVAKITCLFLELPFYYFVAIFAFEFFITRSLSVFFYLKKTKALPWKFSKVLFIKYLKEAFPLFLVLAATILEQKISLVFLKKYETKELLGQFSLAFVVFNTLNFLPNAIVTTLFPTIIQTRKKDQDKYDYRSRLLIGLLLWMGVFVWIGFNTIGGSLFLLVFGPKYETAVEIMQWMAILSIFVFFDTGRKKLLILEKSGKEYMYFIIFFVILSVSFQYMLVEEYSYKGVIGGTFLAYLIANSLSFFMGNKIRKITFLIFKGFLVPFVELKRRFM